MVNELDLNKRLMSEVGQLINCIGMLRINFYLNSQ